MTREIKKLKRQITVALQSIEEEDTIAYGVKAINMYNSMKTGTMV